MTKIAWTNESWNPVVGCSKVSPGCLNCYAEKMACRLASMEEAGWEQSHICPNHNPFAGGKYSDVVDMAVRKWNGNTYCDESALEKPLHWKKPRKIFVCSMGDLFHESVPFDFIDKVMAVMALCPQHDFQCLTKRHERRLEYLDFTTDNRGHAIEQRILDLTNGDVCIHVDDPLSNVWQLSTICNQAEADKFIPVLLQTPAAVRGISVEPMLGPLDIRKYLVRYARHSKREKLGCFWVIIGAESGPNMRYCDPDWMIDLVRQCKAAGVAVFVKQVHIGTKDNFRLSKDMAEWPEELQIQQYPKRITV